MKKDNKYQVMMSDTVGFIVMARTKKEAVSKCMIKYDIQFFKQPKVLLVEP